MVLQNFFVEVNLLRIKVRLLSLLAVRYLREVKWLGNGYKMRKYLLNDIPTDKRYPWQLAFNFRVQLIPSNLYKYLTSLN